jgi:4-amino-4-deoxy-L-arabinose transferase-like glycosyltransferase
VSALRVVGLFAIGPIAVALFAAWLLGRDLGADSLRGDEAMYAEVVLDSREAGRWLPPRLRGEPFVNKPPGGLLAIAASFRCLGEGAFAARFPAVVSGVVTVLVLGAWATRRIGPVAGLLAPLLFVTAPVALGRHTLRGGTFDATVALLVTAALLAHLECLRAGRERWFRATLVAAAAATLFKSMAGPALIAGAVLAVELAVGFRSGRHRPALARGLARAGAILAAGLAVLAALTVAALAAGVADAVDRMVVWDLLRRNFERVHPSHAGAWWFYFDRLARDFGPLLVLLVPLAAATFGTRRETEEGSAPALPLAAGLLAAAAALILMLSVSASKLRWYGLQLVPMISLAVAAGAAWLARGRPRGVRAALAAALLVAVAVRVEWAIRRTETRPRRTVLDRAEAAARSTPGARLTATPGLDPFAAVGRGGYAWDEAASNAFYLRLARESSVAGAAGHCTVTLVPVAAAPDAASGLRLALPADEGPFVLLDGCDGRVIAALAGAAQTSDSR